MEIGNNVFCLGVVVCAAAVLIVAILKGWRF